VPEDFRWMIDVLKREQAAKKGREAPVTSAPPRVQNPKLPVEIIRQGNAANYLMGVKSIGSQMLLVGIPADTPTALNRRKDISKKISKLKAKKSKRRMRLTKLKKYSELSNSYLLRIFEKGSPLANQPPRPVLRPSLFAPWNKKEISKLLAEAAVEEAAGRHDNASRILRKCGAFAAKAARDWFSDPRNGWPGNAPSTIKHKGFDRPGYFSGAMRDAITYVLRETKSE
jgi:hypothetical protein